MLSICAFAMAGGWTAEMTCPLISVGPGYNVQSELDGVVQNRMIFERISVTECGSNVNKDKDLQVNCYFSNAETSEAYTNTSPRFVITFDNIYIQCVVTIACEVRRVAVMIHVYLEA